MFTLTYEYKLKPTSQQVNQLAQSLEISRRVWNYALRERKDWSASRRCLINACSVQKEYIMTADEPYPGFKVQCQRLTLAKKSHNQGDVIVVENLNLIGLCRGMLAKHMLDAGHGQFLNTILPWVAAKRGKAVVKEQAAGTSQECPDCGAEVRKTLSTRRHDCDCGCSLPRDVASGKVLVNRYLSRGAHGSQNAPGEVLAGDVLHPSPDSVNGESPAIHAVLAG